MKVSYRVEYSGILEIPNYEWDESTKEHYENDLNDFVFVYVQEEIGAYQGLKIDYIGDKP